MNDEQFNQLNQNYGRYYKTYQQGLTGLNGNLTEQERMARQQELNGTFYDDFSKSTAKTFADAQARQRYDQLYWQYRGYDAFTDPTVRQRLNLTDDQLLQFNQYNQQWNQSLRDLNRTYRTDRELGTGRFNESQQEAQRRINSTLTPAQRQTWQEMIGRPYAFSPDIYVPGSAAGGSQSGKIPSQTKNPVQGNNPAAKP